MKETSSYIGTKTIPRHVKTNNRKCSYDENYDDDDDDDDNNKYFIDFDHCCHHHHHHTW